MQSSLPDGRGRSGHTVEVDSGILTLTYVRTRLPGAALTLLIMLLLKRHYSLAGADQLDWMLAPTARLVSWFTSAQPVLERGVGYVDFTRGIIVAPACAGINFMIMASLIVFFTEMPQYMCHRKNQECSLLTPAPL